MYTHNTNYSSESIAINPAFTRPGEASAAPRYTFPQNEMLPDTAYQIVRDESMLDGNARLNLATFVTTWMDEYADKLYACTYDKNAIDKDEYPQTAQIEGYCWRMLADLWHAPNAAESIGCSTAGSSEACMLAGLAFKRRWQEQRKARNLPADKPNLVMSSAVQVCWEKFCNFFEVEPRFVPINPEHRALDAYNIKNYVDENTIGVVVIMGVTYTGMYEPVEEISLALDEIEKERDLNIPIHIDGASGAMVAPFVHPDLVWDFRLRRVYSINTSGHKYGLVYPGLGWVVWRDASLLPQSLVERVSYLGGNVTTFALNFSRPGAQILLQYWAFLRYGFDGYQKIQRATIAVARYLAKEIAKIEPFRLWNRAEDIPVFAWRINPQIEPKINWTLYDLSERLRMYGWQIPSYQMPPNLEKVTVARIVVRNGLGMDLADKLIDDIKTQVIWLNDNYNNPSNTNNSKLPASRFHH